MHYAHYTTTLQSGMVECPQRQGHTTVSTAGIHVQNSHAAWRDDCPTYKFIASPEVGLGATVGTL
jgi:hypothetical protein